MFQHVDEQTFQRNIFNVQPLEVEVVGLCSKTQV